MKVLFVASGTGNSGISPIVRAQGKSIRDLGVEIKYFSISKKGFYGYISSVLPLRKFLKSQKIDIIHAHYGLCGIVAQIARRKEKLVVSFMGDDLIGIAGKKGNYTLYGTLISLLNKIYARKYDYCITKSHILDRKLNVKNKKIIPNGVDLTLFMPLDKNDCRRRLKLRLDKKYILFASDPDRPEKNYALAERSVRELHDDMAQLLVAYNKTQPELNMYYNASDCLILTSLHEGSPNVIKEAMTVNLPFVSTNVGDVKELAENIQGCKITTYNAKETASNLSNVLNLNQRTKGRQRIIDMGIDQTSIARKILGIYNNIIN